MAKVDEIRAFADAYMVGREARIQEVESGNYGAYGNSGDFSGDEKYAYLLGSTDYDQERNYERTGRGRMPPWLRIRGM